MHYCVLSEREDYILGRLHWEGDTWAGFVGWAESEKGLTGVHIRQWKWGGGRIGITDRKKKWFIGIKNYIFGF